MKENILTVAAKIPLPDTISKAYLENGTTVLMERLIKCIENNANIKNIVGNRMLPFKDGVYPFCSIFTYDDLELKDTNTLSQNNAIKSALSNDITYIWGPPGTGKTTVIGQIIYELYKHGRSVLVVSHTNMAVDGAIEKAYKAYSDAYVDTNDARCPILRMGDSVRSLPDKVSWEAHASTLGKELLRRKSFLEKRQEKIQNRINEILPQLAKSTWIKENRLQQIGKILENNIGCAANLNKIRHEIDEINIAIQQEKKGHPEYANYLHATTDFQKADEMYAKALEIEPENREALAFSALNKLHTNDYEKALEQINHAIAHSVHNAFMLYIAGKVRFVMKDFEGAKEFLIKSYELEKVEVVENLLGFFYMELGNFGQANVIFENLLKATPGNINLMLNRAKCFEGMNDKESALAELEKAVEIFPDFEEAHEMIRRLS